MTRFVNIDREVRHVETYPEEPYRCANCQRPREDYEEGWQLRYTSYQADDADESGVHVIVEHRDHYYLCPVCATMDPRSPAWRRFLRRFAPEEGPPRSYASSDVEHDSRINASESE